MSTISSIIKDRSVLFLEQKLAETNQATKEQMANGNIIIRDQRLYVNKALLVGLGSNVEMVEPNDGIIVGLTSFDRGKTEESLSMGVTGIIARYAPAANSSDTKVQRYSEFMFDYAGTARIPAELLNAEIEVKVGSLTIYRGRLANLFVNGREISNGGSSYMELKAPKFIKGKQEVQFQVRFGQGVVLPGTATHNHFLQIELDGVATSQKL
jgi:hypothetical protein